MDSKNAITTPQPQSHQRYGHALAGMLGPAFVAAVAYVDPGNVAANLLPEPHMAICWYGCSFWPTA